MRDCEQPWQLLHVDCFYACMRGRGSCPPVDSPTCTACADSITSQMPSVARIRKQSWASQLCSDISGSADTPMVCTMPSPAG